MKRNQFLALGGFVVFLSGGGIFYGGMRYGYARAQSSQAVQPASQYSLTSGQNRSSTGNGYGTSPYSQDPSSGSSQYQDMYGGSDMMQQLYNQMQNGLGQQYGGSSASPAPSTNQQ